MLILTRGRELDSKAHACSTSVALSFALRPPSSCINTARTRLPERQPELSRMRLFDIRGCDEAKERLNVSRRELVLTATFGRLPLTRHVDLVHYCKLLTHCMRVAYSTMMLWSGCLGDDDAVVRPTGRIWICNCSVALEHSHRIRRRRCVQLKENMGRTVCASPNRRWHTLRPHGF